MSTALLSRDTSNTVASPSTSGFDFKAEETRTDVILAMRNPHSLKSEEAASPSDLQELWSDNSKKVTPEMEKELEEMGLNDETKVFVLKNRKFVEYALDFPWKEELFCHEGDVREMELYADVNRISNINSLDNTFEIDIEIELFWKPTREELKTALQAGGSSVNEGMLEFVPLVNLANAKTSEFKQDWTSPVIYFYPQTGDFLFRKSAAIIATLQESFEFQNFPMDVQDLCIKIVPPYDEEFSDNKVRLVLHPRYEVCCSYKMCDLSDFKLHDNAIVEVLKGKYGWDVLNIRLKVKRRWQHYVYRLCGILSLVTLTGCMGFRIDLEEGFNDATGYFSTVLLTVVAFMFVVHTTLPPIPYLTFLDYFIFVMLIYVLAQMLLLTIISFDVDITESFAFWLSVGVWVLIHIIFMIWGYWCRKFEKQKLTMNTQELHKHMGTTEEQFSFVSYFPDEVKTNPHIVWREFIGEY